MSTFTPSMLVGSLKPTGSDVFPRPYDEVATNDVWDALVWTFNDTATRIGLHGFFTIPNNFVGTPAIKPRWTSTATSGNTVWDFDYRVVSGDDSESMDQSGTDESISVTDAAPTAAHRLLTASASATAGNFSAGAIIEWTLFRDGTDGNDTMAASAHLFDLLFSYTDV